MKKVYIVDGSMAYFDLFLSRSYEVVGRIEQADTVVFTGGEDVSPLLYGEAIHPKTHMNPVRDNNEILIFDACVSKGIPMVGICRGGQFLNVRSGGKMYQHVTNHCGDHFMTCSDTGQYILVSSTHHQMMRPSSKGKVLAFAHQGGIRESMSKISGISSTIASKNEDDCEVVFYPDTKCLCFQPHPEFVGGTYEDMTEFFFHCINTYLK